MKRCLAFFLAALLLAGCSKKPATQPTEQTLPDMTGVEHRYIADSSVEKKTECAVRVYELKDDNYFGLCGAGTNLLVLGQRNITALTGEWGKLVAETENADVRPAGAGGV